MYIFHLTRYKIQITSRRLSIIYFVILSISIALSRHITVRSHGSPLLNMSDHSLLTNQFRFQEWGRVGQNREIRVGGNFVDTSEYLLLNGSFR